MKSNMPVIDGLRHGETTAGHCYLGVTDAALTRQGLAQMELAVQGVNVDDYDLIVSSPLQRCTEFSHLWAGAAPHLSISSEIREFNFGDWDGLTAEMIMRRWPGQLEQFWQDPLSISPPRGESLRNFFARISKALEAIQALDNDRVLLVTHGGVIKAMHCLIHNKPPSEMFAVEVKHGSLHRLVG